MIYDSFDLRMLPDLDIAFERGDIKDTGGEVLRPIMQMIQMRVRYAVGEWRLWPGIGVAALPIGQQNTPEVAESWKDIIYAALTQDGLIDSSGLEIDVAPLGNHCFLTVITIYCEPTLLNEMRDYITLYAIFETESHHIYFI
jgi:hypothetical protein